MPNTYNASTATRAGINEDIISKIAGWRAFGAATVTVVNQTLTTELGQERRSNITALLTDIVIWNDVSGAVLNVSSGAKIIWSTKLAVGNVHFKLETYLSCDKGDDLTVAVVGATLPTVAIVGRWL